MDWRCIYNDVLPFTAMITVELTNVCLNVLFKAASLKGMSFRVFIVYSYAFATFVLLFPILFIFCRSGISVLPSPKLPLLIRIGLLSSIGFVAQMASYKGIACTSPTLASALSNLTPTFTFILAVSLRMEKIDLKSQSSRAKIIGTILSISGALVVVLYKGPAILSAQSAGHTPRISLHSPLASPNSDWFLGCLLLSTEYILYSVWYILQAKILMIFPRELVVTFFYILFLTIISAPICLLTEWNMEAWQLRPDVALAAIIYSGFFGSFFSTIVHSWGLKLKGPVYIATFRPLSIAIAAIIGAIFLGEALHLGSAIGAVIISLGFYAVIWGKANEDMDDNTRVTSSIKHSYPEKVPLLQNSTA